MAKGYSYRGIELEGSQWGVMEEADGHKNHGIEFEGSQSNLVE